MSIAGGLPRAVDRARASRCQALQIFTKSAGQWRARPLPPEEIALFRGKLQAAAIAPVVAHNSYLINLATAQPELRAQSIASLGEELDRAEALGLDGLVMHPGSYTSGTEADGLRLIAEALEGILAERPDGRTMIRAPTWDTGSSISPRSSIVCRPRRDWASVSTRVICLPPVTTSAVRRATPAPSRRSTGLSDSSGSAPSI
jgi:deoxyribonuclease-4